MPSTKLFTRLPLYILRLWILQSLQKKTLKKPLLLLLLDALVGVCLILWLSLSQIVPIILSLIISMRCLILDFTIRKSYKSLLHLLKKSTLLNVKWELTAINTLQMKKMLTNSTLIMKFHIKPRDTLENCRWGKIVWI